MRVKQLLRGTPGRRFRALHRSRRRRHAALKALSIATGVFLILVGVVLLPTPGPGLLAAALGAGLIAGESLAFARALDRLELRLRSLLARS
jgi:hypothetical protein